MDNQNRQPIGIMSHKRRSFRGQALSYSDFSYCDIRGFDFTDAVLNNAQFSNAKAGQPLVWFVTTITFTFFLTIISGYVAAYSAGVVGSLMVMPDNQPIALYSSILTLLILGILILITLRRGLGSSLGAFSLIVAFSIVTLAGLGKADATVAAIVQAVAIGGAMSSSIFAAIGLSMFKILVPKASLPAFTTSFLIGSVLGGWEGLERGNTHLIHGVPITIVITIAVFCFSAYVGSKPFGQEHRYWIVHKTASFLSALGGTRFQRANLTDANFTNSSLKSVDFHDAILTRTNWLHARYLKQSYLRGTYLDDPSICQLVVSKESKNKNFDNVDLRGVNLEGRNLDNTTFAGANLSEATLKNANLAGVSLAGTQLYRANLCGASLTGAYIENWGISTDTNFDSVQCDYIYTHVPTEKDPDPCRKPDNRSEIFKPDDFKDFMTPIVKTLNLYQTQNLDLRVIAAQFKTLDFFLYESIDPSSVAIAFQKLSEKYPDADLDVVTVEGRHGKKLRLQAKVQPDTERSDLHEYFSDKYREILALSNEGKQDIIREMAKRDEHTLTVLTELSRLVSEATSQPKFYTEVNQFTGKVVMNQESKGNVSISGVSGNISGIAVAGEDQVMSGVTIGEVSGSVTNTVNQLPTSSNSDSNSLRELLTELQAAIENETELPNEDKIEALEQVEKLAEAGQNPNDRAIQKAAKTSIKILKGTAASLPAAAKLADACSKLIPAVATLLSLA